MIVRQMTVPRELKPDGDMPAFGDKLTPEQMTALARWLQGR